MLIFTDIFSKPNDCCKNYNSEQDWFIMHTVAAYLAFTKGENIVTKKKHHSHTKATYLKKKKVNRLVFSEFT